jgi:hypothetical protein
MTNQDESYPFTVEETDHIMHSKERIRQFISNGVPWQIGDAIKRGDIVLVGSGMKTFFHKRTDAKVALNAVCLDAGNYTRWNKFFADAEITSWGQYVDGGRQDWITRILVPIKCDNVFSEILSISLQNNKVHWSNEQNITILNLYLATHNIDTREQLMKIRVDGSPTISYSKDTLYITGDSYRGLLK